MKEIDDNMILEICNLHFDEIPKIKRFTSSVNTIVAKLEFSNFSRVIKLNLNLDGFGDNLKKEIYLYNILNSNNILAPKVFFSDISNKKYKTYMIMELLGSKTLKDLNNVDSYLETFGKLCTTFHNIESKVQGKIVNDKIVPISIKEINETSFKTNLNKLVEKNCFTKIEMDTILEVHNTYFDSSKAVLCHMDLALSNVLIDKSDSILGIIDWEWAGYYPPEFELAKIELFFAIDKLDFNKFLKGYREISPVRNYEKMRKSFILTHLLQLLNLFKNITFEEDKYKIYKKYLDNFLFSN